MRLSRSAREIQITQHPGATQRETLDMNAIANAVAYVAGTKTSDVDIEALKTVCILCGVGLLISFMVLSYGIDLSPGFF